MLGFTDMRALMSKDCGAFGDDKTQLRPNSRSHQVKWGSMMLAASVLIPFPPRNGSTLRRQRPSLSANKSAKVDLWGRGASNDIQSPLVLTKTTAAAAPMPRCSPVRWPRALHVKMPDSRRPRRPAPRAGHSAVARQGGRPYS
jgi:hypothetical protein